MRRVAELGSLGIMSTGEGTAQQILDIYRLRLKMADEGVTHPKPKVVAGMRQLVASLSVLPESGVNVHSREGF